MKFKKYYYNLLFFSLLCFVLLFNSCNRVSHYTGDYSYKLSGEIQITDNLGVMHRSFVTQRGQMNILRDRDGDAGDVIVTINVLDGGTYSFDATIDKGTIDFEDHSFLSEFSSFDQDIPLAKSLYRVNASGEGTLNDNIMIVEEQWRGTCVDDNSKILRASNISIIAEKN